MYLTKKNNSKCLAQFSAVTLSNNAKSQLKGGGSTPTLIAIEANIST